MKPQSYLFYGSFGAGKTCLAVSSFWDFKKEEPVEGRDGRILFLGRESNDMLNIPEEYVKRFPIDSTTPTKFLDSFEQYLKALAAKAKKGEGPTDIVIDGWTEMGFMFQWAYETEFEPNDNWEGWRKWKSRFIGNILILNPNTLNANIFSTARVAEVRKGAKTRGGSDIKGDPDWMQDQKYIPAMEGWAKQHLGHYQDFVVYMEEDYTPLMKKGKKFLRPIYVSHWLPAGDYRVKNKLAHKWIDAGLSPTFESAAWPEIEKQLVELEERNVRKGD